MATIDLKAEQQASLSRPRCQYSIAAKFFFISMDVFAGPKLTLGKVKLLEILASIPYREWEIRQYARLTHSFRNTDKVNQSQSVIAWGRDAQDNEYNHLLVIHEKMKEEGLQDPWYLWPPIAFVIVFTYVVLSKLLAWVNINGAFHFNAQFEDHAEHSYAEMVALHPEWDAQPLTNEQVKQYANVDTWGDVFRRICLDERDHRNESFVFCGKPEFVAAYEGMPPSHQ